MQYNLFFGRVVGKEYVNFSLVKKASSYDLSIYTSAFTSVLDVIDLRVEIHTSEIKEYLFFLWWSVTTKKSKSILTKC